MCQHNINTDGESVARQHAIEDALNEENLFLVFNYSLENTQNRYTE